MRQLTLAQLEAELQVGTVDMSEVEVVADLEMEIAADGRTFEEIENASVDAYYVDIGSRYADAVNASWQETKRQLEASFAAALNHEFAGNLQKQADAALATVIPDQRGADSVAVADQELPYIVSESQSEDDSIADLGERSLDGEVGGDMDQSGSEE